MVPSAPDNFHLGEFLITNSTFQLTWIDDFIWILADVAFKKLISYFYSIRYMSRELDM